MASSVEAGRDRAATSTIRRLLEIVPGLELKMLAIVLVLLGITATYVAQALLVARAVAGILSGAEWTVIASLIGVVAVLVALRGVLLAYRGRIALRASAAVTAGLRRALASKLFDMGPGWARGQRTGTLQSNLVDGVEAAEPFVARFIPQCAVTVVGALGVSAYIVSLDSWVGAVVLACALAAPLVPLVSWRLIRDRTERWQALYRALYAENLDAVQGMSTLKIFNASGRRGEELAQQAQSFCRSSTGVILTWGPYLGVVGLLVAVGSAFAVGVGALHGAVGALTPVELLTILLLARECFRPVKDLENAYHESWSFRSSADRIFELLDAAPPVASTLSTVGSKPPWRAGLEFENVTFWYEDPSRPALNGFSLSVEPGERVALVGRSGAGKTTVVALLLRFFDPQHGRIRIAGRDLAELALDDLRAMIAVVSQGTYLFHGTVRRNLSIGRPDATDAELEAAARAANAHEFIAALPLGYDTMVGERGMKLSGGERQRIAIARALLKDAPILVLDEATSSVDAANEFAIQTALERLSEGRLTLVIAHRLSTVRHLDRVILLERGRIVEQGPHEALLERRGEYAQLAAAQGLRPALAARAGES